MPCSICRFLPRVCCCLLIIFLALTALSCASPGPSPEMQCPQPRFTGQAPEAVYSLSNPLAGNTESILAGRKLYEEEIDPPCHICHGIAGDGLGPLASQFSIPPRNFACAMTVNGIPDGQLFWIIKNGSPGTRMRSYHYLSDEEIWQLVTYIRQLAKQG